MRTKVRRGFLRDPIPPVESRVFLCRGGGDWVALLLLVKLRHHSRREASQPRERLRPNSYASFGKRDLVRRPLTFFCPARRLFRSTR